MAMIESSIHLLLRLIAMLLALLVLSSMYLFIKRKIEVLRKEKISAYKQSVLSEWIDFLNGKTNFSRTMIPKTKIEIIAIEEILVSYLHNIRSPNLMKKISNFANHHLASYYQKMLHSMNWSVRMNALYRIVDFQMDGMKDQLDRLESRNLTEEERFQLLKFKALFSKEEFVQNFIANNRSYSEFELKKLLINLDHNMLEAFIVRFDELSPVAQYTLTDVIGYKQDSSALSFIESKLQSMDPELRIRSLKAIYEIGFVRDPERIVPFVQSDYWEERLMAAKLLKYLEFGTTYKYLEQLIMDPSWWVRSQAARTILKHRDGKQMLQEFINTGQDRYAIDMAIEALAGEGDEVG